MKQTFREWLKETENKPTTQGFKDAKEYLNIFESFDAHYDIDKIYTDKGRTCYNFKVNDFYYRVYINHFLGDKIEIGFEKRDWFFSNRWYALGFEKNLKNGEIQKLFGTVIYVVTKLYKQDFSYVFIYSNEEDKFNLYLRIVKQIHNKLLDGSSIEYESDTICISKKGAGELNVQEIETKFLKK